MALFEQAPPSARDLLGAIEVRERELEGIDRRREEVREERAEHEAAVKRCDMRLEDFDRRQGDLQEQLDELRAEMAQARAEREHTPRRDAEAEWRDAMFEMGTFTIPELAGKMHMTPQAADLQVKKFLKNGKIRATGQKFMKAKLYEVAKPTDAGAAAELSIKESKRKREEEAERLKRHTSSAPVAGTGRWGAGLKPSIRPIVKKALDQGFELSVDGETHYVLTFPGIKPIRIPLTPRDADNAARELKKKLAGVGIAT